jgi:hypothetical protein
MVRRPTLGWLAAVIGEYHRAIAAEQRYGALMCASRPTVEPGRSVPRRIFDEFYAAMAA